MAVATGIAASAAANAVKTAIWRKRIGVSKTRPAAHDNRLRNKRKSHHRFRLASVFVGGILFYVSRLAKARDTIPFPRTRHGTNMDGLNDVTKPCFAKLMRRPRTRVKEAQAS